MKLKDLSKEELMLILKKITDDSFIAQFKVRAILSEIEMKRTNKMVQEADSWADRAADFRKQYAEVLKPYSHSRLVDIPLHIIRDAERCLKEAEHCDRKWEECMQKLGCE